MTKLNVSGDSAEAQRAFLVSRGFGKDARAGQYDLCENRGKSARASAHVGTPSFGSVPGYSLDLTSPVDRYYATQTHRGLFA